MLYLNRQGDQSWTIWLPFSVTFQARGRADNTLKAYRRCIPLLCRRCGWINFADISASSFEDWRAHPDRCHGGAQRTDGGPSRRRQASGRFPAPGGGGRGVGVFVCSQDIGNGYGSRHQ